MINIPASYKRTILPIAILCVLLFSQCTPVKHLGPREIEVKRYVSWRITLKPNTSDEEKARLLLSIDTFILTFLQKHEFLVTEINITHNINTTEPNRPAIDIIVDTRGESSSGATRTVKPPSPGPRHELMPLSH